MMRIAGRLCALAVWAGTQIALFCGNASAANGVAVSIKGMGGSGNMQGSINRIDIENNKVVKDTIIHSWAEGIARMVRISQDGKRVCFFRDGDKFLNNQIVKGTIDYLSVMDIDGRNLRNIVEFGGAMANNRYEYTQGGPDRYVNWPAGDWIYYQKPTTTEIWRVNVSTLAAALVTTWTNGDGVPFINRFDMNADGSRANRFSFYCVFPAMTTCASGQRFGCNHTLSASGRFANGWLIGQQEALTYRYVGTGASAGPYDSPYQGRQLVPGGHTHFEYVNWNWTTNARPWFGTYINDCINYRHISYMLGTQWLQQTIGAPMIGADSEFPYWAANSDKWIIHAPGKQQVLWNWVDRQVILAGRNRVSDNWGNDAGDFWVRPPDPSYAGTRYEDITGAWLSLGSQSTAPLPDYITGPGCSTPHETALKYGEIVIMPQTVYDTIAAGHPPTQQQGNLAKGWAVLIPDISTIVVQPNSSIDLTVTNQYYDPVDPIFGKPAPPVTWRIIGQGASVSPAGGTRSKLTTTTAFSKCSVEVSITVGSTTKTGRKLVATQAVVTARKTRDLPNLRITSLSGGVFSLALPDAGIRSVSIYCAGGKKVFAAPVGSGPVAIPAGLLTSGMYLFRVNYPDGSFACRRWTTP